MQRTLFQENGGVDDAYPSSCRIPVPRQSHSRLDLRWCVQPEAARYRGTAESWTMCMACNRGTGPNSVRPASPASHPTIQPAAIDLTSQRDPVSSLNRDQQRAAALTTAVDLPPVGTLLLLPIAHCRAKARDLQRSIVRSTVCVSL